MKTQKSTKPSPKEVVETIKELQPVTAEEEEKTTSLQLQTVQGEKEEQKNIVEKEEEKENKIIKEVLAKIGIVEKQEEEKKKEDDGKLQQQKQQQSIQKQTKQPKQSKSKQQKQKHPKNNNNKKVKKVEEKLVKQEKEEDQIADQQFADVEEEVIEDPSLSCINNRDNSDDDYVDNMAESTMGLSTLFDSVYVYNEDNEEQHKIVTIKTTTLILFFCVSIATGMSLGTG